MFVEGLIIGIVLLVIGLILFPIGINELRENVNILNEQSLWKKIVIYGVELWNCLSLTSTIAWILCLSVIFLFGGMVFIGFSFSIFK